MFLGEKSRETLNKGLIIIGSGGHGKVVADIASKIGIYQHIAFLDDYLSIKIPGYELLGRTKEYQKWKDRYEFVIAIGNSSIRSKIQQEIEKEVFVTTLVHPNAVIGESVTLGKGTVVMANAVVNSGTIIEEGVIVNTGSTIDHDCKIGSFVHIAPGCHISGTVYIGAKSWIGVGSCIVNNVSICDESIIGAGATVINDIKEKGTYVGVPAKKVKHSGKNT